MDSGQCIQRRVQGAPWMIARGCTEYVVPEMKIDCTARVLDLIKTYVNIYVNM